MLLAHFIRDARRRQSHQFGERRVRLARSARQRGDEARNRRVAMAIDSCASRWPLSFGKPDSAPIDTNDAR
jgi:hypothetical protein